MQSLLDQQRKRQKFKCIRQQQVEEEEGADDEDEVEAAAKKGEPVRGMGAADEPKKKK